MINELKKYPKTFNKFEKYMKEIDYNGFLFYPVRIYHHGESIYMPEQFLIGCLMEFLTEIGYYTFMNVNDIINNTPEELFIKSFERMEKQE